MLILYEKEILFANCSEAVCRIKTIGLDPIKKEQLLTLLKNRFDSNENTEVYDTYVDEKEIFGIQMITIEGDAPYNNYDEIEEVLGNFGLTQGIDYESEEK